MTPTSYSAATTLATIGIIVSAVFLSRWFGKGWTWREFRYLSIFFAVTALLQTYELVDQVLGPTRSLAADAGRQVLTMLVIVPLAWVLQKTKGNGVGGGVGGGQ